MMRCSFCGERHPDGVGSPWQQWQCDCCGSWNDKASLPRPRGNPVARALYTGRVGKPRIMPDRTKYRRHPKHKGELA